MHFLVFEPEVVTPYILGRREYLASDKQSLSSAYNLFGRALLKFRHRPDGKTVFNAKNLSNGCFKAMTLTK
jgi:hypothetical protein